MKRKLYTAILCGGLLLAGQLPALAAEEAVTVTLPAFPVELNGMKIEQQHNQYPCLVYRDITYVAMTYEDAQLLGLESHWDSKAGFSVGQASIVADQATAQNRYRPYKIANSNSTSDTALRPAFAVTVNGKALNNSREQYPLLVYRDVTYFPLTWRFAVEEFGWSYTFDQQKGLSITPVPTAPVLDNSFSDKQMPQEIAPTEADKPIAQTNQTIQNGSRVYATGSVVNLRSGPGTSFETLGTISRGENLTVVSQKQDTNKELWYQVVNPSGGTAWIASWLVSTIKPVQQSEGTMVSTGVTTQLAMETRGQQKHQVIIGIKNGAGNQVKLEQVTDTGLQLLLDNVTLGSQTYCVSHGFQLNATEAGENRVRLQLQYPSGSYAYVEQEGDMLMLHGCPPQKGIAGRTIVLDPGHGGSDPGAVGRTNPKLTDADIGYDVACRLQALLEQNGATVVFTRKELSRTQQVLAPQRIAICNQARPDAFVSLHANSTKYETKVTGAEVYTYNGAVYSHKVQSEVLAKHIAAGLKNSTQRRAVDKKQNYYVLRLNHHPAVLVECAYLSNREDEKLLGTEEYRQKLAQGIYDGLVAYFQ